MAGYSPKYDAVPVEKYLTSVFGPAKKHIRQTKKIKRITLNYNNNTTGAAVTRVNNAVPNSDGSAGYGNTTLDGSIYTRDTAPDKIKHKFIYYFKKFPEDLAAQLQMDEIASFSVTEATFADQISEIIAEQNGVHSSMSIVDATACVGGNTMSFGKYFERLTSVELDPKRFKMLKHNVEVCQQHKTFGFAAKTRLFCGDYTKLMKTHIGRSDIVFFDPPWGGMDYKNEASVELYLGNRKMDDIVNDCSQYANYIVLKLPKNYNMVALRQGIKNGKVIYSEDLSNNRGVVKMKLVVVLCVNQQQQQHPQQQQQQQHRQMMMMQQRQNANTELKLVNSSSPIITWKDAINSIVGGVNALKTCQFRGLYSKEDDTCKAWTHIMNVFPNGVPCFRTNKECIEFCKTLGGIPTNPQFPHLQHVYTTLIGWEQIMRWMHGPMREYRIRYPLNRLISSVKRKRSGINRFTMSKTPKIYQETEDRCNLPFFKRINEESTMNTLLYMFFHMRCGIYIMIRNNHLQMFVPFVNDQYRNTFSHLLEMDSEDGSMEQ